MGAQVTESELRKLRDFLLSSVGRFIECSELAARFPNCNWQEGIQKLVSYEGYDIVVALFANGLVPRFILTKSDRQTLSFSNGVPNRLKHHIAKRTDVACKSCGRSQGDRDPTTSGRRLRLFVSPLVDADKWVGAPSRNIEAICTACREGLEQLAIDRPTARKLKMEVRRAGGDDQVEVLRWLVQKYPDHARLYMKMRVSRRN